MSVQFDEDVARLRGDCPAADAEALAGVLQAHPDCTVDVSSAAHLHTAVVQVLFAFDAAMSGTPDNVFLTAILSKEGKDVLF
jgi:spore coat polysaccharide biosynthesis protein SpsF (cytidylyltransferase family)